MTIFEVLRRYLDDELQSTAEYLVGGGIKNFPEYTAAQARHRAFRQVREHINEIEKSTLEDGDDE